MNIARYGMHLTAAVALMGGNRWLRNTNRACAAGDWIGPVADGVGSVRLVGGGKLMFTRDANGLHVSLPEKFYGKIAFALKVRF